MINFIIAICLSVMIVRCTVDDWNKDNKPVNYICIKGEVYFKEGSALIKSTKYKGDKCKSNKGIDNGQE